MPVRLPIRPSILGPISSPARSRENTVRAALALARPAYPKQRSQDPARPGRRPIGHAAANEIERSRDRGALPRHAQSGRRSLEAPPPRPWPSPRLGLPHKPSRRESAQSRQSSARRLRAHIQSTVSCHFTVADWPRPFDGADPWAVPIYRASAVRYWQHHAEPHARLHVDQQAVLRGGSARARGHLIQSRTPSPAVRGAWRQVPFRRQAESET